MKDLLSAISIVIPAPMIEVTPDTASSGSESRSGASESNPMPIIAGVAIAAGVGVGGYFMMKKKK